MYLDLFNTSILLRPHRPQPDVRCLRHDATRKYFEPRWRRPYRACFDYSRVSNRLNSSLFFLYACLEGEHFESGAWRGESFSRPSW